MELCPEQTEAEVAHRLASTLQPDSPNTIRAAELREWAIEYLAEYDEESGRFPELAGKPHWNLWMIDARFQDAMFAVLVFRPGGVELLCGTGEAFAVKRYANSDFPDDLEQLSTEMARLFTMPKGSLYLGREEAEAWLGRGW